MKRGLGVLIGLVGLIAIIGLWFVSAGNTLVRKEEGVKATWAQVENVYQRRLDLIPNLVNTVKGYARHESETLEKVIQARAQALRTTQNTGPAPTDPKQLESFQRSQEALSSALGRLLVVVEKYPDLKANENFRDLQVQLEGTENRITVERRRFNEVAQDYNSSLRLFPTSIVAGIRGFKPRPYFEAQQGAATAPKVEF
ncbi:MAG: LemA family protein [Bdellovibrionota bacterium]